MVCFNSITINGEFNCVLANCAASEVLFNFHVLLFTCETREFNINIYIFAQYFFTHFHRNYPQLCQLSKLLIFFVLVLQTLLMSAFPQPHI